MALALDLTPQPLSTGASSTTDANVQAHLLLALPSAPHVPLPSLSSPPPAPSSPASPSTLFPYGSAPSAASAPPAPAVPSSDPCPSQPTTPSRSRRPLPTTPASATNSRPSTPPPSAHLTPGLLLCPPVGFTRCSSFSSFATDDSDAMDMSDFDIREYCSGDWQVSDDDIVCIVCGHTRDPRSAHTLLRR